MRENCGGGGVSVAEVETCICFVVCCVLVLWLDLLLVVLLLLLLMLILLGAVVSATLAGFAIDHAVVSFIDDRSLC